MSTAEAVLRSLDGLVPPTGGDAFAAARVEAHGDARVGLAADGHVAILLPVDPGSTPIDTHLRHFRARMRALVSVLDESGELTVEEIALLEFDGPIAEDHAYFALLAGSVLDSVRGDLAPGSIERVVGALAETFQPRHNLRSSALGIWGELVFALAEGQVERAVRAWHADKSATHDFAFDSHRVEVKTTEGPGRVHAFEVRQLAEDSGIEVTVASIVTTRTDFGSNVWDLVADLDSDLGAWPDLRFKVYQLVAATLGADWKAATEDLRWDRVEAETSLRTLAASEIPRVDISSEPLILSARIHVNLEPLVH